VSRHKKDKKRPRRFIKRGVRIGGGNTQLGEGAASQGAREKGSFPKKSQKQKIIIKRRWVGKVGGVKGNLRMAEKGRGVGAKETLLNPGKRGKKHHIKGGTGGLFLAGNWD